MKTIVGITVVLFSVGSGALVRAQPNREEWRRRGQGDPHQNRDPNREADQRRHEEDQRRHEEDDRRHQEEDRRHRQEDWQRQEADRQRQEADRQRHEAEEQRRQFGRDRYRDNRPAPLYRARVAPPPMRNEIRSAAPTPRHVWINGYWGWQGGRHIWIGGRWNLPPASGRVWVEGRWVAEGGEWVFSPGYWAVGSLPQPEPMYAPPAEVVVNLTPPPPRAEVMPVQPGPGYFWIGGSWHWDGHQNVWLPGRWETQRAGWVWEPARWGGGPRHARYRPGHWRHP